MGYAHVARAPRVPVAIPMRCDERAAQWYAQVCAASRSARLSGRPLMGRPFFLRGDAQAGLSRPQDHMVCVALSPDSAPAR
jgi:hypothetical protein